MKWNFSKIYLLVYVFVVVLGLHCCAWAFSSCSDWGLLCCDAGASIVVASLVAGSLSGGSDSKESACNARDLGSIRGLGRSPGERNGNPLQYSCLENPMERATLGTTVHRLQRVEHDLVIKQHR